MTTTRRKLRNMESQKSTILTCIGVVTLYLTVMLPNYTINCNLIGRLPHTTNTVLVVFFSDYVCQLRALLLCIFRPQDTLAA